MDFKKKIRKYRKFEEKTSQNKVIIKHLKVLAVVLMGVFIITSFSFLYIQMLFSVENNIKISFYIVMTGSFLILWFVHLLMKEKEKEKENRTLDLKIYQLLKLKQ